MSDRIAHQAFLSEGEVWLVINGQVIHQSRARFATPEFIAKLDAQLRHIAANGGNPRIALTGSIAPPVRRERNRPFAHAKG